MEDKVKLLRQWISEAKSAVFFGGAGVSTESGIPDFRSRDGLYSQTYKYPPEQMLSHGFYEEHTEEFFDFYRKKLIFPDAKPNTVHYALARLEAEGHIAAVVTQNVDGLHTAAGSKVVYELHGSGLRNYCTRCKKFYPLEHILNSDGVPKCECGGVVKPDVVLYGEGLDDSVVRGAINAIRNADLLIVGGTSLVVYPAASMIDHYAGNRLVLINKSSTNRDSAADLVFNRGLGEVFGAVMND